MRGAEELLVHPYYREMALDSAAERYLFGDTSRGVWAQTFLL